MKLYVRQVFVDDNIDADEVLPVVTYGFLECLAVGRAKSGLRKEHL